jgi:hypothetical protein
MDYRMVMSSKLIGNILQELNEYVKFKDEDAANRFKDYLRQMSLVSYNGILEDMRDQDDDGDLYLKPGWGE